MACSSDGGKAGARRSSATARTRSSAERPIGHGERRLGSGLVGLQALGGLARARHIQGRLLLRQRAGRGLPAPARGRRREPCRDFRRPSRQSADGAPRVRHPGTATRCGMPPRPACPRRSRQLRARSLSPGPPRNSAAVEQILDGARPARCWGAEPSMLMGNRRCRPDRCLP